MGSGGLSHKSASHRSTGVGQERARKHKEGGTAGVWVVDHREPCRVQSRVTKTSPALPSVMEFGWSVAEARPSHPNNCSTPGRGLS